MQIEVLDNVDLVARRGAAFIAEKARAAVALRGRFVMAVSGGRTPWLMMRALTKEKMPWEKLHLAQVDERVAPSGDPERNLTQLQESFLANAPLPSGQFYSMPVDSPDLEKAAKAYAITLQQVAGLPPVLDLVHLGLGTDGHTASLVPGDAVLDMTSTDVAVTGVYQERRRMTLTYPIINRSRIILWIVTGEEKAEMLVRLRSADPSIPAGRIRWEQVVLIADRAAARTFIHHQNNIAH